jgi:ATP-dependent DNA helicase RecQ
MKFFARDEDFCKMRLILNYFGEKTTKKCGICGVCRRNKPKNLRAQILAELKKSPADLEQLHVKLLYFSKEKILEELIVLLDIGDVKMQDFRTYSV